MIKPNIQPSGQFTLTYDCPACGRNQAHTIPATFSRVSVQCNQPGCRGWLMVALHWGVSYGTHGPPSQPDDRACPECETGRLLTYHSQGGKLSWLKCTDCTYSELD